MKTLWPHYTFLNIIDKHFANASLALCTSSVEDAQICAEQNITYTENYLDYSEDGTGNLLNQFLLQFLIWFVFLIVLELIESKCNWDEWLYPALGQLSIMFIIGLPFDATTAIGYQIGYLV